MPDLDAIKTRLAAATPGPWTPTKQDDIAGGQVYGADGLVVCEMTFARPEDVSDANADFIGNAPADLAALVAEVERLRKEDNESVDKIRELQHRNDLLVDENIRLSNQGPVRVAAPPRVLAKKDAEIQRLREAISIHQERVNRSDAKIDWANYKLWEVLKEDEV